MAAHDDRQPSAPATPPRDPTSKREIALFVVLFLVILGGLGLLWLVQSVVARIC